MWVVGAILCGRQSKSKGGKEISRGLLPSQGNCGG